MYITVCNFVSSLETLVKQVPEVLVLDRNVGTAEATRS